MDLLSMEKLWMEKKHEAMEAWNEWGYQCSGRIFINNVIFLEDIK